MPQARLLRGMFELWAWGAQWKVHSWNLVETWTQKLRVLFRNRCSSKPYIKLFNSIIYNKVLLNNWKLHLKSMSIPQYINLRHLHNRISNKFQIHLILQVFPGCWHITVAIIQREAIDWFADGRGTRAQSARGIEDAAEGLCYRSEPLRMRCMRRFPKRNRATAKAEAGRQPVVAKLRRSCDFGFDTAQLKSAPIRLGSHGSWLLSRAVATLAVGHFLRRIQLTLTFLNIFRNSTTAYLTISSNVSPWQWGLDHPIPSALSLMAVWYSY